MFDIVVNTNKGKKIKGVRCPVNECGIGKARDNLIQLRGWKIAPHHAELRRHADGVYIEDKTGSDGVLINGEPVTRHGPLHTSDKIEIGSYIITVGVDTSAEDEYVDDVDEEMLKTMIGVHPHAEIKEDESIFKEERFMWRNRVHDALLEMMDLRRTDIGAMDEKKLRHHVQKMINEIIVQMDGKLPADVDVEKLKEDVLNEAVGLGPLEELLKGDEITEIMVNKFDEIYVEKGGKLTLSGVTFSSDDAVMSAIERIVSRSAAGSTKVRRTWTRASRTVHVSTRSFHRSRCAGRVSRSGSSRKKNSPTRT